MLQEEAESFLVSERDVGNVKNSIIKIHLLDETPIQRNYKRVPKPLHQEKEGYLEDLLCRGWIKRYSSNHSSPIVVVRKKMVLFVFVVTIDNLIPR